MTFIVEPEFGDCAGHYLDVGARCDRHLLVVPLHHIEGELDELTVGEVRTEFFGEVATQVSGLCHQGIGERDCSSLMGFESVRVMERPACGRFIESVLGGNCRPE